MRIFGAALPLVLAFVSGCKEPQLTLITALEAGDRRALAAHIDPVLAQQDPRLSHVERVDALRAWIADHDGVAGAELNPDLIDSEPPVQQIWVRLASDPDKVHTVGIVLDRKALRFNLR